MTRVGPDLFIQYGDTGALIASALADERAGIENAVPSLLEWLAEEKRFPQIRVAAISDLVLRAREWIPRVSRA